LGNKLESPKKTQQQHQDKLPRQSKIKSNNNTSSQKTSKKEQKRLKLGRRKQASKQEKKKERRKQTEVETWEKQAKQLI
jgi:hypothetical protein